MDLKRFFFMFVIVFPLSIVLMGCGVDGEHRDRSQAAVQPTQVSTPPQLPTATLPGTGDSIPTLAEIAPNPTPTPGEHQIEPGPPPQTPAKDVSPVVMQWLQGIPCAFPCWMQITPGKTQISTAENILKDLSSIPSFHLEQGGRGLSNRLMFTAEGFNGSLYFDSGPEANPQFPVNTVFEIDLSLQAPVRLETLIDTLGPPRYAEANHITPATDPYAFFAFFPDQHLVIDGRWPHPPKLTPNLGMLNFTLYPASVDSFVMGAGHTADATRILWQGYKDFTFYCANSLIACT